MIETITTVFCLGVVFSFYLNNKRKIDKTRDDLEDLFKS